MKNGQYLTTVPKAWLKHSSLFEYGLLEWYWEDSKKGTVLVTALKYRCNGVFVDDEGTEHECILDDGHKRGHKYDGL